MRARVIQHSSTTLAPVAWIAALACLTALPAVVFADAGAVRASERHGNRQVTVFTDPTPLRAGPIDVSVLVQDTVTGTPVLGDTIEIDVTPRDRSSATVRYRATSAAASNKLFQAATFDLRHSGWWEFTVDVRGPQDSARVHCEVEAGEPLPPWQSMWFWFCWPFVVIAVFAAHELRHWSARARARIAANRK
jgi:hypothetical protein